MQSQTRPPCLSLSIPTTCHVHVLHHNPEEPLHALYNTSSTKWNIRLTRPRKTYAQQLTQTRRADTHAHLVCRLKHLARGVLGEVVSPAGELSSDPVARYHNKAIWCPGRAGARHHHRAQRKRGSSDPCTTSGCHHDLREDVSY